MKKLLTILILFIISGSSVLFGQQKIKRDTLNFVFENKKLSGFIDYPENYEPSSIIIIIPGHGNTYFRESIWYYDSLINRFSNIGLACFRWDRAGCGNSEGIYDHNQSVQSSAKEVIAAIDELKRRNIPGSTKIGLWGISRGGYICPLVIQEYPSIAFWISVSGTDGLNSWDYKFESDLRFAGKSKDEAKLLVEEYLQEWYIIENGGSYDEYLKAQQHLLKDTFCISYLGLKEFTKESYMKEQESIKGDIDYERDPKTKSIIVVPNFVEVLNKIKCPVLAIFGEKDFVVDWQKTRTLYLGTIGKNDPKKLTIKTFPDGDHTIIKCKTGASNETLDKYVFCDGYLDTMITWLVENNLTNK